MQFSSAPLAHTCSTNVTLVTRRRGGGAGAARVHLACYVAAEEEVDEGFDAAVPVGGRGRGRGG